MNDNEKLIEEAANAVRDAWQVRTMRPADERPGLAETASFAALTVFEKAHTPTEDERDALVARLGDEVEYRVRTAVALYKGGHDYEDQVRQGRASVRLLAAGFRRSEVPEPSAEAVIDEETDAIWQAIADALGGFGQVLNSHDETAEWVQHYLFRRTPEPLGEPSDAQVLAAFNAFFDLAVDQVSEGTATRMRAALRAAGGVR